MASKIFGTDGIRAKTFEYPLVEPLLKRLGWAFKSILPAKSRPKALFIRDTRASGRKIFKFLSEGFAAAGFEVVDLGVLPTPSLSYLVGSWNAVLGCVISASHNPPEFNGVKFFDGRGQKIPDLWERRVESLLKSNLKIPVRHKRDAGVINESEAAFGRYRDFLISCVSSDADFRGLKIVLDCGQGAAYKLMPDVFKRLGAQVFCLGANPNGGNINKDCGAMHPQALAQAVVKNKADIGFALDGDADRLVIVNEKGGIVPGEWVLATAALERKRRREPGSDSLVTTVMSNFALKNFLSKRGIKTIETPVGDRWVLESLLETNSGFGGENSGHFIWPQFIKSGDGSLSAILFAEFLKNSRRPASQAFVRFKLLPHAVLKVEADHGKLPLARLPKFVRELRRVERLLDHNGRVFVRYSGTEPVLRILIEGGLSRTKLSALAERLRQTYLKAVK